LGVCGIGILPVFVRFRLDKQNPSSLLGICGTGILPVFVRLNKKLDVQAGRLYHGIRIDVLIFIFHHIKMM
jgi:hypothetical protein